jgi:hypothetical protein
MMNKKVLMWKMNKLLKTIFVRTDLKIMKVWIFLSNFNLGYKFTESCYRSSVKKGITRALKALTDSWLSSVLL